MSAEDLPNELKIEDLNPNFALGVLENGSPYCSQISEIEINPAILAGLCVSLIDSVISSLPDEKQIDFESKTTDLLKYMLENRHEYTLKYKI